MPQLKTCLVKRKTKKICPLKELINQINVLSAMLYSFSKQNIGLQNHWIGCGIVDPSASDYWAHARCVDITVKKSKTKRKKYEIITPAPPPSPPPI